MSDQSEKKPKVIVLGAGVAGLTVAHELAERDFGVTVYDLQSMPGGKAATQYPIVQLMREDGNYSMARLPAEHGFRHFPSFYRHVIDTMQRIPFDPAIQPRLGLRPAFSAPEGKRLARSYRSVADNLIPTQRVAMARPGQEPTPLTRGGANTLDGMLRALAEMSRAVRADDIRHADVQRAQVKVLQYMTSCKARRDRVEDGCYGGQSWWDFLGGERFSPRFGDEIETLIRTLVAMDAKHGNCRTIGNVAVTMFNDIVSEGGRVDRILNGPTSDQWLLPWWAYLSGLDVQFKPFHRVDRLVFDRAGNRIVEVHVTDMTRPDGKADQLTSDGDNRHFDYVVAALPLEAMKALLSKPSADDLVTVDSKLEWLRDIDMDRYTSWMVGIQFYLQYDIPIVRGNVYFPEAPWKLSGVSQAQFWGPQFKERYGAKQVRGIFSVDVCDWLRNEGQFARDAIGRTARECDRAAIADEIWAQLRASLDVLPERYLGFHLDDSIRFPYLPKDFDKRKSLPGERRPVAINQARHFVHPPGSHHERPTAETRVDNLFLAGDFVISNTDLATMEAANETGRRAVNAILSRVRRGFRGEPCAIFDYEEPAELSFAKDLDKDLLDRGEPHLFEAIGLIDRLNRGAMASADSAVRAAVTAVQGADRIASGLPDFLRSLGARR